MDTSLPSLYPDLKNSGIGQELHSWISTFFQHIVYDVLPPPPPPFPSTVVLTNCCFNKLTNKIVNFSVPSRRPTLKGAGEAVSVPLHSNLLSKNLFKKALYKYYLLNINNLTWFSHDKLCVHVSFVHLFFFSISNLYIHIFFFNIKMSK